MAFPGKPGLLQIKVDGGTRWVLAADELNALANGQASASPRCSPPIWSTSCIASLAIWRGSPHRRKAVAPPSPETPRGTGERRPTLSPPSRLFHRFSLAKPLSRRHLIPRRRASDLRD